MPKKQKKIISPLREDLLIDWQAIFFSGDFIIQNLVTTNTMLISYREMTKYVW